VKKLLAVFVIIGAGAYIFRDRILAGALELGSKISQFVADRTEDVEEDESDPRTIRFPMVEEDEK
jgi:hypothetical protein